MTAPLKPDSYKISTDPFFVENVRDILNLDLNPPDKPSASTVKAVIAQMSSLCASTRKPRPRSPEPPQQTQS